MYKETLYFYVALLLTNWRSKHNSSTTIMRMILNMVMRILIRMMLMSMMMGVVVIFGWCFWGGTYLINTLTRKLALLILPTLLCISVGIIMSNGSFIIIVTGTFSIVK